MAKLYKDVVENFITSLTDICNETEILYEDRIDQEELFVFQEKFVDALLEAHENGLFTQRQLLKFNHVFGITNEKG